MILRNACVEGPDVPYAGSRSSHSDNFNFFWSHLISLIVAVCIHAYMYLCVCVCVYVYIVMHSLFVSWSMLFVDTALYLSMCYVGNTSIFEASEALIILANLIVYLSLQKVPHSNIPMTPYEWATWWPVTSPCVGFLLAEGFIINKYTKEIIAKWCWTNGAEETSLTFLAGLCNPLMKRKRGEKIYIKYTVMIQLYWIHFSDFSCRLNL